MKYLILNVLVESSNLLLWQPTVNRLNYLIGPMAIVMSLVVIVT